MGYTDPQSINNPTAGATLPAAWGDTVRDDLEWLARNMPHARVYNNANISIATSGTRQALTFNSERYDVGAMHSTVTNTSRLTVPTGGDGMYGIGGHVDFAVNATGARQIEVRLNGATLIAVNNAQAITTASTDTIMSIYTQYQLVAGDYVELTVIQTSGGALNATVQGNYSPEFFAHWICI